MIRPAWIIRLRFLLTVLALCSISSFVGVILTGMATTFAQEVSLHGVITGLDPEEVFCRNLTTGQEVVVPTERAGWNCEVLGLIVNPGDRIVTGQEGLAVEGGVNPAGLLGLWHLDGNTTDASGHGHHGTLVGAPTVISDGVAGQAYHFDGNDAIDGGNLAFARGRYTVSLWFRTTRPATTEDWRVIIAKGNNGSGDQTFEIFLGDGRRGSGHHAPMYTLWDNGRSLTPGTGADVITAESSQVNGRDGNWHMVTALYARGRQVLYVDGCLAGLSSYAGPFPRVANGVRIGGFNSFGPFHHAWIGDIDEVSIYDRVLAHQEVKALYSLHRPARGCP